MRWQKAGGRDIYLESLRFILETKGSHGRVFKWAGESVG